MLKDIKNWKKIPTETYKDILKSSKVRYEEMMSQSASITGKIDKMIVINAGILVWISKIFVEHKDKVSMYISVILLIYIIGLFWYLVSTFFARITVLLGSSPKDILGNENELSGKDVDGDYNEDEKIKVYYYLQCFTYNNRISDFKPILDNRANQLKMCLILTFITFVISVALFVFTNS